VSVSHVLVSRVMTVRVRVACVVRVVSAVSLGIVTVITSMMRRSSEGASRGDL